MWTVDLKGNLNDPDSGYELSVVRHDNNSRRSWGWGSTSKIILFGSGIGRNRIIPGQESFALGLAGELSRILNLRDAKVVTK